jgi:hypothetical protein
MAYRIAALPGGGQDTLKLGAVRSGPVGVRFERVRIQLGQ